MKLAVTLDEVGAIFIYVLQPIFMLGADRMNYIRRKIPFRCKAIESLVCGPHGLGTCLKLRSSVDRLINRIPDVVERMQDILDHPVIAIQGKSPLEHDGGLPEDK